MGRIEDSEQLRAFALSFPGAWEDFPWGDRVVKVGKKVFVFLGRAEAEDDSIGMSVKLPMSASDALELPNCAPTGYGLGKAGWVSVTLEPGESEPTLDQMKRWIEESYRAVAGKKLIKEWDAKKATP